MDADLVLFLELLYQIEIDAFDQGLMEDVCGDVSGSEDQNKIFVGMLIMLIFSEALVLYGMIVALVVGQNSYSCGGE